MAGEYVPGSGGPDCSDYPTWGRPSPSYYYIFKGNAKEEDYPEDACEPWYHETAQIDSLKVNTSVIGAGLINITGPITSATEVTAAGITLTSRKPFDIPHPTKKGYRLRHVCLEGPESGVYFRGRLTGKNIIDLPDYWQGLVDPETITVSLTQIGSSQDLIVEKVEWGKRVRIKSGSGTTIDCYYLIHAERADGEKLIVEYEGKSPDDYPGDNSIYSINK
jgi:hypothetical protein|tara:strand:- start:30 stop:689 length:660 start_codon:yes stop_codon:yes gene_type:complete